MNEAKSVDVELDEFERPVQETIDITVGGKTAQYIIKEVSAARMQEIFAPANVQDKAKAAEANRVMQARLISACVLRKDGREITFDEARSFRVPVCSALEAAILKANGLDKGAKEDAKNE